MYRPSQIPFDDGLTGSGGMATGRRHFSGANNELAILIQKLWRRKGLILTVTILVLFAAIASLQSVTPRFTAYTRVMLGMQKQQFANINEVVQQTPVTSETIESESLVIKSGSIAEQVVSRLNLESLPEFNPALREKPMWQPWIEKASDLFESLIEHTEDNEGGSHAAQPWPSKPDRKELEHETVVNILLSKIDAVPLSRSHVIEISVETENPLLSARIANTVANVYTERQMIEKVTATKDANKWLYEQIQDLQARVVTAERGVEDYRREHGLYETKSDNVVAQQVAELNTQIVAAEAELATARARFKQAKSHINGENPNGSLPEVLRSDLVQRLLENLVALKQRKVELSSRYRAKHPALIDLNKQIADLKGQIKTETQKIVEGLRHDAAAAETRYKSLVESSERLKSKLGQRNESAVELNKLEREADASRNLLRNFLERAQEIEAQTGLQRSNSSVISKASVPRSPSFPPTMLIYAIALLAGAGMGILFAILLEGFDRTFHLRDEVEDVTGLRTLAMLPTVGRGGNPVREILRDSNSQMAEALRALYSRLVLTTDGVERAKSIMFASAVPNEGKSQIAASIAHLSAIAGLRAIVLDCDWQRPTQHRLFRQPQKPGLADLLAGNVTPDEAVWRDPTTGVHAMFAGDTRVMQNEMLRFYRLPLMVETLSKHYDVIILDTPPVLVGSEVLHLAKLVDSAAFVVRWGSTPRDAALNALNQLTDAGGNISGIVLSQVHPKRYRRYDYVNMDYVKRRAAPGWRG